MSKPTKGAVAAGHEVTSNAAAEILQDGGNAYDAIIAGLLTATVVEPIFASLGGGGCLMSRRANAKQAVLYDFFAATPSVKRKIAETDFYAIEVEFGEARQEFHIGLGAVATPGFVPGLFAIHRDLASLPMKRLSEPAIRAAREGIAITAFEAYVFQVVRAIITATDETKALYAPAGQLLKENDLYKNVNLANTIAAIAEEGEALFTNGSAAQCIAQQSEESGGHLTLDDLQNYKVIKRPPLNWRYHQANISLNPAPAASGCLIAFGLGFLEAVAQKNNAPDINNLMAAMSATNEIREKSGKDVSALFTALPDAPAIARQIDALTGLTKAYRGTTHLSIIDERGNAAAATVTNGEGNGHMTGDMGFMLNNMLGEEDLNPAGFHQWAPNTRLSTMMAPTLLDAIDGTLTAMGSGGSNRIRTALLQTILNLIDKNMTLAEAVHAPRIHLEKCDTMSFEDLRTDQERSEILRAYPDANAWPERNFFFGGVNAVARQADGTFASSADPRRDGSHIIV